MHVALPLQTHYTPSTVDSKGIPTLVYWFFSIFFDILARFFKKILQYALWHLGKEFVELE